MKASRAEEVAIAIFAIAIFVVSPAVASAQEHPLVERARSAADRADFENARAMLADLSDELNLTAADLRDVLLLRADLSYALGDLDAMERDLALLARFTDREDFPEDLPPVLRERIDAHRRVESAVFVDLRAARVEQVVRVAVRASAPDDLVRGVRLFVRTDELPTWNERALEGGDVEIASRGRLELYAEVVGLGGTVLAGRGSRDEPISVDPERRGPRAWPFVVAAVVTAVALGVGLGVGLTRGDDPSIQVGAPLVSW